MITEYDIQEILPRVSGDLRKLLDEEIERGNEILEVASKWPSPNATVFLRDHFTKDYQEAYPSLSYDRLNDPKNWIEDYSDMSIGCMIAVSGSAGFKK